MQELEKFYEKNKQVIEKMGIDKVLKESTEQWWKAIDSYEYEYHFEWMGRPIIQTPQDIVAMQELIWHVKPDLIIETGIARGGSLIFYSSILELLGNGGEVLGIDIDIREHNRIEIEKHPMFKNITMFEGNAVSADMVNKVKEFVKNKSKQRIMLILDSNHTHEHVLKELELYSDFVKKGSYLIVFDTVIEDFIEKSCSNQNRPWGKGNNPKTAVWEFLQSNKRFEVDKAIQNKLVITVAPDGYLKCTKD